MFQFDTAALLVGGQSPYSPGFEAISLRTLEGVTSADVSIAFPRADVFSWDGAGGSELIERPRAELTFSYLHAGSGANESALGFISSPGGTVPALAALNEERNYYLLINQRGLDAVGTEGYNNRVLSMGNGVITHYDFSAAVGQPTMINVAVQGLNLLVQASGSGQALPSIGKQTASATTGRYTLPIPTASVNDYFSANPSAIRLTFDTGCAMGVILSGANTCHVDSFSFSIDLPRAEVKDLGWAYPLNRPIQWPVTIGIQAEITLDGFQLDALNRMGCPDSGHAFSVGFQRSCSETEDFVYRFDGAKLESQNLSLSVGRGSARGSLNWSVRLNDPNRVGQGRPGFYIQTSGTPYTSIIFPQVDYVSGIKPLVFNLSESCYLSVISGPGFLSGNSVFVTDAASTVVVRAFAADGSDTQDVTVTIA